jgi:pyridoxamine 5'-phosphate oxidase
MSLAPWRSPLARALHNNRSLPYARYFQLATVRADGRPANRTVVFRGFLEDTNQLKIITDSRSQKADQIQHQSWGEICWYFPKTREQFRFTGQLTLVGADYSDQPLQNARQTTWQDLSDAARLQFAWPYPGEERTQDNDAFSPLPPNPEQPLPNFCLLLLEPVQVDHLELRGDPQNRWLYCVNTSQDWYKQAVNP